MGLGGSRRVAGSFAVGRFAGGGCGCQRLYVWTNAPQDRTNAAAVLDVGTNYDWMAEAKSPGRYWFAVSAIAGGVESDLSNVLPVIVPESPTNLSVVAVETSATISGPWTSNLFIRLKPIQP